MLFRRLFACSALRHAAAMERASQPRWKAYAARPVPGSLTASCARGRSSEADGLAVSPYKTSSFLVSFVAAASGLFVCAKSLTNARAEQEFPTPEESDLHLAGEEQELVNWSGTHSVKTARYYQPETLEQLKAIVEEAHVNGQKLRPVGSALSPNALAFSADGMVNIALMDSILSVDKEKRQVTVQAGARVSQVVDALRPHGLTLENYASIAEQQIGGFIQVGAHGTGATIPPVDEQVVALKMVTPGAGEVILAASDDDPMLFKLARTSLGLLGVVAEVTLQCVPAHSLVEKTFVASHADVASNHATWLLDNRHLRYMWIPYTDSVVVVMCNPASTENVEEAKKWTPKFSEAERLEAPRELLKSVEPYPLSPVEIDGLNFTSLRDALLAVDPLNPRWVRKVNVAEAEFWRRSEGLRIDSSDRVLGFDCGGQQWVSEVVFPVHDVPGTSGKEQDLEYVMSVLKLIEELNIAAPSPIEQRWTAPSSSPLSPACERPEVELAPLYSWVGIIMYLPDVTSASAAEAAAVEETRSRITSAFQLYKSACADSLWEPFRASEHWAKIELPEDADGVQKLQDRIARKYPVATFNAIRRQLFDPRGILANKLSEGVFDADMKKNVS